MFRCILLFGIAAILFTCKIYALEPRSQVTNLEDRKPLSKMIEEQKQFSCKAVSLEQHQIQGLFPLLKILREGRANFALTDDFWEKSFVVRIELGGSLEGYIIYRRFDPQVKDKVGMLTEALQGTMHDIILRIYS